MKRLARSRSVLSRLSMTAAVVVSLAGAPLAAQGKPQAQQPVVTREAPASALVREASARLGVSRTEVAANEKTAAAAQQQSETMKWAIIIGVAVLAALLIVALAD